LGGGRDVSAKRDDSAAIGSFKRGSHQSKMGEGGGISSDSSKKTDVKTSQTKDKRRGDAPKAKKTDTLDGAERKNGRRVSECRKMTGGGTNASTNQKKADTNLRLEWRKGTCTKSGLLASQQQE